jgi:hypothetical protein
MTQETKPTKVHRQELSEGEAAKEITNDSLGTVDPADSTGLDTDEQAGNDPAGTEKKQEYVRVKG